MAYSYIELANLYSQRGDPTSAIKCVQKAKVRFTVKFLSDILRTLFRVVSCPLDAAVMAYYLIGKVHYNLREYAVAESVFKGSLAVLQQLASYVSSTSSLVKLTCSFQSCTCASRVGAEHVGRESGTAEQDI